MSSNPVALPISPSIAQPVRVQLDELGVIEVRGADAASFLQAQLTNDVVSLGESELRRAGYCTAKGRLLATLRVWRDEQSIHLLLPREILPGVLMWREADAVLLALPRELVPSMIKRLSMFVLRAKAKLTDATERYRLGALLGTGSGALLGEPPRADGAITSHHGLRAARLAAGGRMQERFFLIESADQPQQTLPAAVADASRFCWSEIDAGCATVLVATQEMFVPQMINFELVGGVDFKKGCYPGQEVVARSQYLGKLRRRMSIAQAAEPAQAGDDIFVSGEEQPIGTVALAAPAPSGGFDLLFECPADRLAAHATDTAATALPDCRCHCLTACAAMEHWFIYYKLPAGEATRLNAAIRAMQEDLAARTGAHARLMRRPQAENEQITLMEIYEDVADSAAFASLLDQALAAQPMLAPLRATPRRRETFVDC
jgi:tRNA-modifying protein YgfZ